MMKPLLYFFTFVPLLFSFSYIRAETLVNININTNYLWRGVTQTSDESSASVGIEYHSKYGSYFGLWGSNINYGERPSYELNTYIGQKFELEPFSLELSARNYYFPTGGKYNYDFQPIKWDEKESSSFTEGKISITYSGWNIGYSFSDNYLDSRTHGYYIEFNYTHQIIDELFFKLHFGTQSGKAIDDTPEQSVSDHSVTLQWKDIYFTASDLDDNDDGRQSDNVRYVLGLHMQFGG